MEEEDSPSAAMVIHVISAGFDSDNIAKILINNKVIEVETNESGHHRGLHIVVISPIDCKVMKAKVFDTYKSSAGINDFINKDMKPGSIVACACKDECVSNLSDKAKHFFSCMGSKQIWQITYRQSFAFIGIYKHQNNSLLINERRSPKTSENASITQIF